MNIKILFIDDQDIRDDLKQHFNDLKINGFTFQADAAETFETGIEIVKSNNYDLIVLDLCKGTASETAEQEGLSVLKEIQEFTFVPVVFHSAISYKIENLRSVVVGVTDKKDGIEILIKEIERIISSNLLFLKERVHRHIEEEFKKYFWDTIHTKRDLFKPDSNDVSLGYLMLRRLANSLSKQNIKELINDSRITEKAFPMEFYVFPVAPKKEYEAGDILEKGNENFIVLTPDCDFVQRFKGEHNLGRKVGKVLLAKTKKLEEFSQYSNFKSTPNKDNNKKLCDLIRNNVSDRYFFLPNTPFIQNLIIDFQDKIMVDYSELNSFLTVAKLDAPYAQSMTSSFIRYYNRIGSPDIDIDYIINKL
jgi:DNA-binding NarL/FixJ family response regulator